MTKNLIIIAAILIFAGLVLGAVQETKVCPECKKEIVKTDYCVLRNGAEVHFKHALADHFKPLTKK